MYMKNMYESSPKEFLHQFRCLDDAMFIFIRGHRLGLQAWSTISKHHSITLWRHITRKGAFEERRKFYDENDPTGAAGIICDESAFRVPDDVDRAECLEIAHARPPRWRQDVNFKHAAP